MVISGAGTNFVRLQSYNSNSPGFGIRVPWVEAAIPSGHEMVSDECLPFKTFTNRWKSFKEAVEIVSNGIFIKVAVPNRLMGLTERTSKVRLAFDELEVTSK